MIYQDSRYANGNVYKAINPRTGNYDLGVTRDFPSDTSSFYYYVWRERDRIEYIAAQLLGDSNAWWRIMDYNPEVIDPVNIRAGSVLRIPYDD